MNVIGFMQPHVIKKSETLLDIAREYGLGYNEIALLYPDMDSWAPPKGEKIDIPSVWILPPARHEGVVINIPEMRLYRFIPRQKLVKTYPIGIGRQGFKTPLTDTRVAALIRHPDWTVPPDMREKLGRAIVPPGPANPLGDYWIGLAIDNIGIHGTNFPWGIGRRVSHGCLRMYPEHIKSFFYEVEVGTGVEIVYKPVKVGIRDDKIFVEIHPDIHDIIPDMYKHAESLLKERELLTGVDHKRLYRAVAEENGVPAPVGIIAKP
ncbi:MAG: L,D-transpeptidase family protein [Desulfobacteraceae bacterium]|nr:L,D-transpeptidase family protein [Desulfobacteraceae bacterium]